MAKRPKIVIIGHIWPEPKSSAAGSRMMQLLNLFRENEWELLFGSAATKGEQSADLSALGVREVDVVENSTSFDQMIKKEQPDIVLFDRFMTEEKFGWRVAEACPDSLRILNTEDLHGLRKARELAVKQGESFSDKYLFNDVAKREIAAVFRSDLTLVISEAEEKLLKGYFRIPATHVVYLPFLIDRNIDELSEEWTSFDDRNEFVWIGNFQHPPNVDSVKYLKNTIWPMIRDERPASVIRIYGAYPGSQIQQLHNKSEGFLIEGRAEESINVLGRGRVCLAPLRYGAGLKGKLIDAMLAGTPFVTTSIGAEGISGDYDWPGIVSDSEKELVSEAINLVENESDWRRAQNRIKPILKGRFQKPSHQHEFISKIETVRKSLGEHREKNFMGAMLHHHSLASTKFMSRWIEEKNRDRK